jgi:hypothetical protein
MNEAEPAELGLIRNATIRCAHAAQVDPKFLKPHPLNPNKHPPKQIEMFITILGYQGWRRPITVSKRSGYITKGHGAWEAAMSAGFNIVPVDYQDYEDEAQELADIVADNQLQRMSEMDTGRLAELFVQLDTGSFNFELTGFESMKVESMLSALPGYRNEPDAGLAVDYNDEEIDHPEQSPVQQQSQFAESTIQSGGPAVDQPHAEGLPAPQPVTQSHVRMIQLFFNEQTVSEFMTMVEHFQRKLEIDNVTDTVLAVLRSNYSTDVV